MGRLARIYPAVILASLLVIFMVSCDEDTVSGPKKNTPTPVVMGTATATPTFEPTKEPPPTITPAPSYTPHPTDTQIPTSTPFTWPVVYQGASYGRFGYLGETILYLESDGTLKGFVTMGRTFMHIPFVKNITTEIDHDGTFHWEDFDWEYDPYSGQNRLVRSYGMDGVLTTESAEGTWDFWEVVATNGTFTAERVR